MRAPLTALALTCAALALGACGGDDDGGGGGPAKTFAKGQPVAVEGKEYKFTPGNVVVEGGGGAVRIEFRNGGSLAHNLRLVQGGQEVGGTPTFVGGETRSASVNLKPGEYVMECTVGDHAALGMKGKLTVR